MTQYNLESFKQSIIEAENKLKEVAKLYSELSQDRTFTQLEEQSQEISKAINNLKNSNIPIPDTLLDLKNQLTHALSIKFEVDGIYNSFISDLQIRIAEFSNEKRRTRKYKKGDGSEKPETVVYVVEVCKLVFKNKIKYSKAFSIICKKFGISTGAVRHKCTGLLNLKVDVFKNYIKDQPQALISHLKKTFPEHEDFIKSELENI